MTGWTALAFDFDKHALVVAYGRGDKFVQVRRKFTSDFDC